MSRFWPPILHCARCTSGYFSEFWNDNHKGWGSIWPDSLVLCALTNKDFTETNARGKAVSPHRASFRDNTITEYENRLRRHSKPMKVFRYFATIKMKNSAGRWEVFMTPQDFLRSILPGARQPENRALDRYRLLDEEAAEKWHPDSQQDSIFLKLEDKGLIGFSDYVLLTLLLSIPERHFRIAMNLFDREDNGTIDIHDLEHVLMGISRGEASMMNSRLKSYLFGSRLKKALNIDEFLEFLRKLHKEILVQEYEMLRKPGSDVITELDFAKVVLAYSRSRGVRRKALQQVKTKFGHQIIGITLEEFMSFFRLVQDVETVDMALTFHYLSRADIRPSTLQQIARVVSGVKLSPHLTEVIFAIFDHDGDGIIQREEFARTLHDRQHRVLQQNILRITSGICILGKCFWKTLPFWRSRRIFDG